MPAERLVQPQPHIPNPASPPPWGRLRPNKTLNVSQQGFHIPGTKEQHSDLEVFPTEAGHGGFMKAWSFHFLCKLVLILANSTHCITEIGKQPGPGETQAQQHQVLPL